MKEKWAPIKDFLNYQVSSFGRVKSLPVKRFTAKKVPYISKERILKPRLNNKGYGRITLRSNGKSYDKTIHRLVASAFLENIDDKPCVNHIDFNPLNNHPENLEWCTYSENTQHSAKSGRMSFNNKISQQDVKEIREKCKKTTQRKLAKKYGITFSEVSLIVNRKRWRWL